MNEVEDSNIYRVLALSVVPKVDLYMSSDVSIVESTRCLVGEGPRLLFA